MTVLELFKKLTKSDRVEDVKISFTSSFRGKKTDEPVEDVPVITGIYRNGQGTKIQGMFLFDGKEWEKFGYPG